MGESWLQCKLAAPLAILLMKNVGSSGKTLNLGDVVSYESTQKVGESAAVRGISLVWIYRGMRLVAQGLCLYLRE